MCRVYVYLLNYVLWSRPAHAEQLFTIEDFAEICKAAVDRVSDDNDDYDDNG